MPRTGDIRLTYEMIALRKNEVISVEILTIGHFMLIR